MMYADGGYATDLLQQFYDDIAAEEEELFIVEDANHYIR